MQLSDTEWTVMNFIWRSQPTEAGEVIEELGVDNAWTDATVKTMLHRLVTTTRLLPVFGSRRMKAFSSLVYWTIPKPKTKGLQWELFTLYRQR